MGVTSRSPSLSGHIVSGVIVPARVAAVLAGSGGLVDYYRRFRGADPEVDAVISALIAEGLRWQRAARTRHGFAPDAPNVASSGSGLSTSETARRAGCSLRTVQREIAVGRLHAELIGGRFVITPDAIEHWLAARAA